MYLGNLALILRRGPLPAAELAEPELAFEVVTVFSSLICLRLRSEMAAHYWIKPTVWERLQQGTIWLMGAALGVYSSVLFGIGPSSCVIIEI